MSNSGAVAPAMALCLLACTGVAVVLAITGCGRLASEESTTIPSVQPPSPTPLAGPAVEVFEDDRGFLVTRFSEPVSLVGDAYLTTDRGVSLALTREARATAHQPGGAERFNWDRRIIMGAFEVTGWERGAGTWALLGPPGPAITAAFAPQQVDVMRPPQDPPALPEPPDPTSVARLLLDRLNEWRRQWGAPQLTLGDNPVAARHARLSLEKCTSSHWDVYGLKPYLRYALTGGIQYVEENWSGTTSYCITADDRAEAQFVTGEDMERAVDDLVAAFSMSGRHTASLLDHHARYAHVGVAWDERNLKAAILIERHLVNDHPAGMFSLSPAGELIVWGSFREPASLSAGARIRVYYEAFPSPLDRGQVARTSCYTVGDVLLAVVVPPGVERQQTDMSMPHCHDPAQYRPNLADGPKSEEGGLALHRAAVSDEGERTAAAWVVPASLWQERGRSFLVQADISGAMLRTGRTCTRRACPGVYTVVLEAVTWEGDVVAAAQQSIWLGGAPPAGAVLLYSSPP